MQHRREIDGLRAVAVVPVILFHAGFSIFPGGYVGVDVFFVISGYLITSLILEDCARGTFSLARFYERRARRILPALFVVILATLPAAFVLMTSVQLEELSESIASVVLFLSNFYFLSQISYFAPDAEMQPLLHTWSLAVEEQFYLFFPLVFVRVWRWGRWPTLAVFGGVALASLAFAEWAAGENAARSFYFTGSRIWELLAGTLTAVMMQGKPAGRSDLLAGAGLAMILAAMLFFDALTPTPTLWTVLPVMGAILVVVFARQGGWVAGLLSTRIFVGVGLISYSAYLWHHPLFALARLQQLADQPPAVMLGLCGVTFLLAWATWAWVEQPFRRRDGAVLRTPRQVLAAASGAGAMLLVIGVAGHQSDGFTAIWRAAWPDRARIMDVLEAARVKGPLADDGACRFNIEALEDDAITRIDDCAKRLGPGVAIVGDSHAADIFGAVAGRGDRLFVVGLTGPGCHPGATARHACAFAELEQYLATTRARPFRVVIYVMRGALLLNGPNDVPAQLLKLGRLPLDAPIPDLVPIPSVIDGVADYLVALSRVAPVVWLGPRSEPSVDLNFLIQRGCEAGLTLRPNTRASFFRLDSLLDRIAADRGLAYLSQDHVLDLQFPRDFGGCEGVFWADEDHLSPQGEAAFGRRADIVAAALARLTVPATPDPVPLR